MASPSYQFSRIADNGFGPRAGISPRMLASQTAGHVLRPRCPFGGHHVAAVYWRAGQSPPVAVCPCWIPAGRPVKSNSGHQLLGELQGCQFFILRALRRYARSCCATAPPSRGAGRRPPALGGCCHDPREQRPGMTLATRKHPQSGPRRRRNDRRNDRRNPARNPDSGGRS